MYRLKEMREINLDVIEFKEVSKEIWNHYIETSKSKWAEGGDERASVIGPYIIALAILIPLLFMIFD